MLYTILPLLLPWKCFLCVLFKLAFLNFISPLSLQKLDDEIEERNCRVSDLFRDKEIFLSLSKPWLERLLFLSQGFQSTSTSTSNKWSCDWEVPANGALAGTDLNGIFGTYLLSGFRPWCTHPNTSQLWKDHLQNCIMNRMFLQTPSYIMTSLSCLSISWIK